ERAVVIDGPVNELEIAVCGVSIEVEKIGRAHFAEANLDAALGKFGKERVRTALIVRNASVADRNDLVPHQPRDIRRFAKSRIAHDVKIQKAGKTECFADAMAAGFLDIAEQLRCRRQA